jgi:hypothetical protein
MTANATPTARLIENVKFTISSDEEREEGDVEVFRGTDDLIRILQGDDAVWVTDAQAISLIRVLVRLTATLPPQPTSPPAPTVPGAETPKSIMDATVRVAAWPNIDLNATPGSLRLELTSTGDTECLDAVTVLYPYEVDDLINALTQIRQGMTG